VAIGAPKQVLMKTGLYVIVENGVIPQEVFTRASRGIEVGTKKTKTKILPQEQHVLAVELLLFSVSFQPGFGPIICLRHPFHHPPRCSATRAAPTIREDGHQKNEHKELLSLQCSEESHNHSWPWESSSLFLLEQFYDCLIVVLSDMEDSIQPKVHHHNFYFFQMSGVPLTAEELSLLQPLTARAAARSPASPAAKLCAAEGDVSTAGKVQVPKRRKADPLGISAHEQYHAATSRHASYFAGRQSSLPTKDNRAEAREKARLAVVARW
jgi:hypothetical protein